MRKFIKEVGLFTTLGSGAITFYSFFTKSMSKKEIIQACDKVTADQESKITNLELQRQLDLSHIKKLNNECSIATKESIEYRVLSETEKNQYGDKTESYNFYLKKFKDAQDRALEIQQSIEKYIEDAKNSRKFIED